MTRKIEIPRKELINLYSKKMFSTRQIGKILDVDASVIQKRLKENNITLRYPRKKIHIERKKLYDLYITQKLSVSGVAQKVGISHCSLYYKLKEAGIEIRKKKIFKINREELGALYLREKLSCSQIAKMYGIDNVTVFTKLKKYSIQTRKYSEANIRHSKKEFDGSNELKAYMIGFRLGDLNVKSLKEGYTVRVKSSTTKEDQLELIKEVYGKYGHFWAKKYGQVYNTMVFLDKSFNFLVKKEDAIEDWIRNEDKHFFAFLAGYADAEANIGISQGRARFRIRSYDKNILFQIYKKLNSDGINTKFGLVSKKGSYNKRNQNKDCWGIFVNCKEDLLSLFSLIKPYMKHKKRCNDLQLCKNNILERNKRQGMEIN